MAERVGFEPTRPFSLPVFKTSAFDRSAISPNLWVTLARGFALRTRKNASCGRDGSGSREVRGGEGVRSFIYGLATCGMKRLSVSWEASL